LQQVQFQPVEWATWKATSCEWKLEQKRAGQSRLQCKLPCQCLCGHCSRSVWRTLGSKDSFVLHVNAQGAHTLDAKVWLPRTQMPQEWRFGSYLQASHQEQLRGGRRQWIPGTALRSAAASRDTVCPAKVPLWNFLGWREGTPRNYEGAAP
jgi:hypothetical protein